MRRAWLLSVVAGLIGGSCGDAATTGGEGGGDTEVNVFAASSLTDAFSELGETFRQSNPSASLSFNFTASSDLVTQIEEGAPADVFASADESSMDRIVQAGLTEGRPRVFVHNKLAIAVPPDNPGDVDALIDLGNADLIISLCVEECPAGRYARELFEDAGLEVEADSLEPEVKAVVTRVQTGEADAGIVYTSDIAAAGDAIRHIEIPQEHNVVATYPIATLEGAPPEARQFIDLVLSRAGQRKLQEHGFLPK